jgi:hypothetical protein
MVNKEIVIAAYDKPTDWLDSINTNIKKTIYRKGSVLPLSSGEILIDPNIGRCVHTFFNHILTNYNNLSDYTFFAQDYPFDHWEDLIDVINNDVNLLNEKSALSIGGYWGFHFNSIRVPSSSGGIMHTMSPSKDHENGKVISCYGNGMPHDHNSKINVDTYWDMLFEGPRPNMYEFMPGGHFGITKEHVKLRSKELYGKVVELLESDDTAPWMIERLECYIFNPKFKAKL